MMIRRNSAAILAGTVLWALASGAMGQMPQVGGAYPPQGMPPQGMPPGGQVAPVGYGSAGAAPMFVDPAAAYGHGDACDVYGNPLGGHGAGGGWDQCGPHFYDISADFLHWRRDSASDPSRAFTSQGINGPRVLTTDSLDMGDQSGFRLTGRLDVGAMAFVEATYFGSFTWETSAAVTGNADLFSVFSDFGLGNPVFLESEAADFQSLELRSELHNSELNWRHYWVAQHPSLTGTWLMGARWVRMTEDFAFRSRVNGPPAGSLDYLVSTENDLVGFQVGGDAAWCLLSGVRLVSEGKVGIYNNRVKQLTRIAATTLAPGFTESADGNETAFVGDGRIAIVADILPSFSIRAGYEFLVLDRVALGANNVNTAPIGANRVPFVNDDGDAVYHGFFGGLEYVW